MEPRRRRHPGIDRAKEHIIRRIRSHNAQSGDPLPSVTQLASETGVAFATMWRALRLCADEGLIESKPRCRYRIKEFSTGLPVVEANPGPDELKPFPSAWHRTRYRIEGDILNGAYPPGTELPSIKELRSRYGVAYETLKKALSALCESGMLQPFHRTYQVPVQAGSSSRTSIILLGHRSPAGSPEFSEASIDFHRILERECGRRNIRLAVQTWYFDGNTIVISDASGISRVVSADDTTVLGYILVAAQPEHRPNSMLKRTMRAGKPVCVLDETGNITRSGSSLLRCFSGTASDEAGRKVARYLLSLGHKAIAYISPFHEYHFSRMRLEGMKETFQMAGIPNGVGELTMNNCYPVSEERIFPDIARKECDTAPLRRFTASWRRRMPPDFADAMDGFVDTIHDMLFTPAVFKRQTTKLFDRARPLRGVTCWVGANDKIGLQALDYLRTNGVNVPHDIAVVGFDNTREALTTGLTSFDFNFPAIAHAMLDHIVTVPSGTHRGRRGREVDGMVIERDSSRSFRKKEYSNAKRSCS